MYGYVILPQTLFTFGLWVLNQVNLLPHIVPVSFHILGNVITCIIVLVQMSLSQFDVFNVSELYLLSSKH